MEYKEPLIFMRWSAMHANMTGAAGGKKYIFFFHPYFSSVKERCQYSTCIQFPGSNVPIRARASAFARKAKKVTQVSWSGHVRDFLLSSKTKDFGLQSEHLFYFFPPEEAGGVALTFIAFLLIEQDPLA